MKLSEICIKRPILATMLNLALILFGIVALMQLPVRELPNIDPPIVSVTTVLPGASAEVIESEVTEVLEEAVANIPGIDRITSQNREEVSEITIEFSLAEDVDVAAQDVRDRVARVRGRLPDEIEEPIVAKQEADARPILWVALYSDRYSTRELTTLAENQIKDRLQTVNGVSSVILGGAKRFAMRLWLDPAKMAAHGVTVHDVEDALQRENIELPSGRIENLERELTVQTRGELKTPDEFNRLIIRYGDEGPVRLQDIGRAEVGVEDERAQARYNSVPAIGLGIVRQSRANTIAVAEGVKREVEALKPTLPEGVNTFFAYDESVYVKQSVTEVGETILIAFALVVLVVFLFLRNIRTTLVPAVAIPVSVVGVFAVLQALGYSINILTLLALVLAIGVVVDDAIVVLENIYRHVEEGMRPMDAAFKGMQEVGFAVIATTLALVAVFTPLAFQTTETGQLFREFAMAMSGAVVISSFVALTLSPAMCARFLARVPKSHGRVYQTLENLFNALSDRYRAALTRAMAHRWLVLGVALISIVLGVFFLFLLEREFLPDEDKGRLFSIVIAPEGATAEYTDSYVRKLEKIVSEQPEAAGYFSAVALSRGAPGQAKEGLLFIRLKERDERQRSVQDMLAGPRGLRARFFAEAEGVLAIPIVPKAIGRGFSQPFQLVLQSHDLDELQTYAERFSNELRQEGFLMNVRSNFEISKPEVRVKIQRDRAASLGVSVREIARTLQIMLGGLDLSTIKRTGKLYDVIAQLERENRLTPAALETLYVRTGNGDLVPLSTVVTLEEGYGPNVINHYNRIRSATIEATPVEGVSLGEAVDRVEAKLARELPPGFRYAWAGETEDFKEAGSQTLIVLLLAIVIVYMVLASQFESLVHPFTVLLAVPLSAIGAFGLLYLMAVLSTIGLLHLTGMTMNLFSQIGLVLLVGLVTKNSILLVTFANQERERGEDATTAMIEAGATRLRPILMTALSTIIGLLPIAIGFGAGAESRRPMGIVVVGGMLTSTLLTLFVIPVIYTLLDDLGVWVRRRTSHATEPEPESEMLPAGK